MNPYFVSSLIPVPLALESPFESLASLASLLFPFVDFRPDPGGDDSPDLVVGDVVADVLWHAVAVGAASVARVEDLQERRGLRRGTGRLILLLAHLVRYFVPASKRVIFPSF